MKVPVKDQWLGPVSTYERMIEPRFGHDVVEDYREKLSR
jgi:hypothetical protein